MCSRCVRMVALERFSSFAASLLDTPLAMSWRISFSRSDSGLSRGSIALESDGGVAGLGSGAGLGLGHAEVAQAAGGEVRLDHRAAGAHVLDGLDDLVHRRALEQVARGPGLHRLEHFVLLVEDGEDEDLHLGPARLHLARDVDAAHARQPEVQQQHVGVGARHLLERGLAGQRRADDLDVRVALEQASWFLRILVWSSTTKTRMGAEGVRRGASLMVPGQGREKETRVPLPGAESTIEGCRRASWRARAC